MSKYRGPRLRIVRRLGEIPSLTQKSPNRYIIPGHYTHNRKKPTQFAYRLAEKQKIRFYYGILEKQIIGFIKSARRSTDPTGQVLIHSLEIRLDNIIYRAGFAPTLASARQLVNHGHVLVDQIRVTIPSFSCSPGQTITFQEKISKLVEDALQRQKHNPPSHLSLNQPSKTIIVNRKVDLREVPLSLKELLVVEYYSNRIGKSF
jgi:small subunit ribosomal protein S4